MEEFNATHASLVSSILHANDDSPVRFCSEFKRDYHFAVITDICGMTMLIIADEDHTFCRAYPWRIDMCIEEVEKIVADYCFDDWFGGDLNYIVVCTKEDK